MGNLVVGLTYFTIRRVDIELTSRGLDIGCGELIPIAIAERQVGVSVPWRLFDCIVYAKYKMHETRYWPSLIAL